MILSYKDTEFVSYEAKSFVPEELGVVKYGSDEPKAYSSISNDLNLDLVATALNESPTCQTLPEN